MLPLTEADFSLFLEAYANSGHNTGFKKFHSFPSGTHSASLAGLPVFLGLS